MVGGSNPPSATSLHTRFAALSAVLGEGADLVGIADSAPLVLAVSGGPDSIALLNAAADLAPSRHWQLVVGHLDHGLRLDSASDAAFVTEAADALALPWRLHRTDVAALAKADGVGIEEAGRVARYRFLEEVADELGAEALIVTAHTADDRAESVLLNLARGSGLHGLRGMPARRGRVVRPFLHARRAALRAALDEAGIAYRLDPSNADVTRSRARIRASVIPALEALNPSAVEAVIRMADLATDEDSFLDALAADELAGRQPEAGGPIDWREPPPAALGRRVLRLAIGDPAPSADRIEALLEAGSRPRSGLVVELGRGRTAEIRNRRIVIGL